MPQEEKLFGYPTMQANTYTYSYRLYSF